MRIKGDRGSVTFDMGNGYVAEAMGEMLIGRKFVAEVRSMKYWNPPHQNERITPEQIEWIKSEVKKWMNENTMQIIFE